MSTPQRLMQRRAAALIAASSAAAMFLLPAASAATAAVRPAMVAVPQGIGAAALTGSGVFGPTKAATRETVSFVLRTRHERMLEAEVEAGMPGGYLSVARFAAQFGQPLASVTALKRYLATWGITSTSDADRLSVTARGTAGEFDKALGVQQEQFEVPAIPAAHGHAGRPAMQIHGSNDQPLLPSGLARFVLSVLGLTNYPTFASNAVHQLPLATSARPATVRTGSLTPAAFARNYHLRSVQRGGSDGQGQTIGIVTLASLRPSDAEHFWAKDLKLSTVSNRIRLDNVDGGSGKVSDASGSGETTLDVEQSGALAPAASIIVYQAPNTDYGFLDGYLAAASQDKASAVSTSWGESETDIAATVAAGQESSAYARSFDEAFLELAAQGQSSFVAAGDDGAYDASGDLGATNLSVDDPSVSPWTTSAGGSTLPGTIPLARNVSATITAQRTWGWDWLWPHYRLFTNPATNRKFGSEAAFIQQNVVGGGGGFSAFEPAPAYQRQLPGAGTFSAVPYLTPTNYATANGLTWPSAWSLWQARVTPLTPAPAVVTGLGLGRETPDLVANADPFTGYQEYFSGFTGSKLETGWGGTSFVAPQLAGAAAVIDSYVGHRTGFWNPFIYQLATHPSSPFTPLDSSGASNDDIYYTGTAGNVYNVGSGLGTPNLAKLATAFADRG